MGKADNQQLPVVQQQSHSSDASRTFFCRRCSMGFYRLISFKCVLVLIFSVAAFLSAFFWVIPLRYKQPRFDAEDSIKLSATAQSYFRLHKPVAELVPYITRLEYDINEEIGVPSLKVAVLSMHQADLSNWTSLSNWTDVVFGFLPTPVSSTENPVALSLLKSSLIDLFLRQHNLTLTSSIFGEPSSFEILKFPNGITMIPERTAFISETLFNFTLNSSIYDIKENLPELKEQLKLGLHLMPNEAVYVQVSNKHGSTKDPPVTVEASVASGRGTILPERLRQLAQTITGSPPKENLGLDHSVFGKVKEISLSSFLNHSLHPPAPTPTPTPTPTPSPSPSPSPSQEQISPPIAPCSSPALSPNFHRSLHPCPDCYTSEPCGPTPTPAPRPSPQDDAYHSLSPVSDSPVPTVSQGSQHCGSTDPPSPSPTSHPHQMSSNLSPHSPSGSPYNGFASPIHVSSSSKYSYSSFTAGAGRVQCFYLNGLVTFLLLGTYPR